MINYKDSNLVKCIGVFLVIPFFLVSGYTMIRGRYSNVGPRWGIMGGESLCVEGFVFGRKIDGSLVKLGGAEIILRNIDEMSKDKRKIKADSKGFYKIKRLPLGNYDVLVTPGDNPWRFRPIEGGRLHFQKKDFLTGKLEPTIWKVWYLNECNVLRGICVDSRSGKRVKFYEGSVEYSPLDLEKVKSWGSSFAKVGLSTNSFIIPQLSQDGKGVFEVYLCKSSLGKGFKYFLTSIIFTAKGYKRKVLHFHNLSWSGEGNRITIKLEPLRFR